MENKADISIGLGQGVTDRRGPRILPLLECFGEDSGTAPCGQRKGFYGK